MIFEIYPIAFSRNKDYNKKIKICIFLCLLIIFLFFIIWYVGYSEPYKIYRNNNIDVIQYRL